MTHQPGNIRARILIADDDGITRHVLRMLLREFDFEVVGEAMNGEQALEKCESLHPDIVCLDLNMPKKSGIEVLGAVREKHPGIKIIIISSVATPENVNEVAKLGADGFVVKPFHSGKVLEAVLGCMAH